ncbi:MAG: TIM barrel protein [Winogradskyella sp.]|uniref:sugar phosphate isomerase/epimerase family protein n=1 Tax=Winogradskyella sp. TaxID=1883156 RepID=UPI0025DA434E|nr:TIM barrel protein [Winogradskyella sp.]NRB83080.1 TIM barrel protein [Winogradskyella sp.]
MNRKEFITSSLALGAYSLLPFSLSSCKSNSRFKLGYQLYSIRDEMAKDPISTLKKLKAMGYQDFEHYGYDEKKLTYYGFKTKAFKAILNDLNLNISSGHYPFANYFNASDETLLKYVDKTIEGALLMQSKYIVWPWLAPENRNIEDYKKLSDKLNIIGERVTNSGLGFAYHNHGYEFKNDNGKNGFDIITNTTDSKLVKLQLDMYWIMHEGFSTPKQLIENHPGRFVMWHIKDMHKVSRDYTELGNGSIDYIKELPDPKKSGLAYFYIEQGGNFTVNSTKSASDSAKYFKAHLEHLL